MSFPEPGPFQYPPGSHSVYARIGPIFDTAYLKHIDPGMMKEITLISARAELAAAQAHASALQQVVNLVEKTQMR